MTVIQVNTTISPKLIETAIIETTAHFRKKAEVPVHDIPDVSVLNEDEKNELVKLFEEGMVKLEQDLRSFCAIKAKEEIEEAITTAHQRRADAQQRLAIHQTKIAMLKKEFKNPPAESTIRKYDEDIQSIIKKYHADGIVNAFLVLGLSKNTLTALTSHFEI